MASHKQKLSIALKNYQSWTVPTFTAYLHSCVINQAAGVLQYLTDIIHESGCIYQ
ncbi:hypothetical protein P692DRAFT_20841185 [Suillus brevipes Sb2]|nr:hypothetical protein P692DRAFT_201797711 [Suillus brevipes Sb2]KAG2740232.1 hypothetical protein P692DRAFT_20841185 [Suillus brevipes Sb2]